MNEPTIAETKEVTLGTDIYENLAQQLNISRKSAKKLLWARQYVMGVQKMKNLVRRPE